MLSENSSSHCRCFTIVPSDIDNCGNSLERIGFKESTTKIKNIAQVLGFVARLTDMLQIHFKMMKDGTIEGKLEPPNPDAHQNPSHTYSAHKEIEIILRDIDIEFNITSSISDTCNAPRKIRPDRHMHVVSMNSLGILSVLADMLIRESLRGE